jgi:serine phosphatase RsbU (regulator of sigma subunit)/anti-sigma regulatory factor (Ser/Thr protein kinase)/tetratricopeptide (TPR) repeat protein
LFQNILKEQLKVPAKIEFLGELRDFVTKVGHRHGFSERVINAFKLSIDEAATNIIKHAYRDWEGSITIRAIVKKNSLTIVLIDQGKYFDPRQVSDPDLQRYVDIGKKGGLGIFIMRRLLDEIDYRKTEEGNELWMVKYRDVARKRRLSVPSLSMTLKARYWLISTSVFSLILLGVLAYNYFNAEKKISSDYFSRGRTALSVMTSDISSNLQQELPETTRQSMLEGTNLPDDIDILAHTLPPLTTLQNSEYRDILYRAVIADNNQYVLASTEGQQIFEKFTRPQEMERLQSDVLRYRLQNGTEVLEINAPVHDRNGRVLCTAYLFVDNAAIREEIAGSRWAALRLTLLVWLIGAAGLFLLIILVMNPFRRLSEWVKQLGQPGVADEMDIDATTEIGEIAQAFSDITLKLRESQVNLAEQERLQKEMQVAQEIQQTLLPGEFPEIEGYGLSSYYAAAKEVGGDYYDFVEVDKDTLGIVVADVSGKGVPGSLVMTMIRTALRTEARGIKDAAEVLARVNEFVVNDMKKGMFVTLFYVIIDSKKRRLNYASAGHNPMILYRASRNKTYYLNPHGFPIGISLPDKNLFRNTIESDTLSLNEGDILLIYTDGVTEAMNSRRHLYGEERFLNVIREHGNMAAEDFVSKLHEDLLSFTEGTAQSDDITLVAIKEKSSADKIELDRAKRVYRRLQEGIGIREACESEGLSSYAYYTKYKEIFEQGNIEELVSVESESIEAKHLSIEEKTKLYDVIMRFPEFGAKKISEELHSERYHFMEINPAKVYEELVRAKLNTRELREAFVHRGGKKRRPKPPGTPMLTLDGRVIIQKGGLADVQEEVESEEREPASAAKKQRPAREAHGKPDGAVAAVKRQKVPLPVRAGIGRFEGRDVLSYQIDELLGAPLEDLFDKRLGVPQAEEESEMELPATPERAESTPARLPAEPDLSLEELGFEYADSPSAATDQPPPPGDAFSLDGDLPPEIVPLESIAAAEAGSREANLPEAAPGSEPDFDLAAGPVKSGAFSEDDLDFAEILETGDGIEDPFAHKEELKKFPAAAMEDAVVIRAEKEPETNPDLFATDAAPALQDVFEEFLELEDEAGLISESGELESDIIEQILQNEIASRMNWEIGEMGEAGATPGELWNLQEVPVSPAGQSAEEGQDRHRLSFDELIDILSAEKNEEKQWAAQGVPESLDQTGNQGEALAADAQAMSEDPERDRAYTRALSRFLNEEYRETIEICTGILDRYGEDNQVRSLLGQAYFRTHAFRESTREFQRVLRADPKNKDAHEKLGIIYANQGAFPRAIAHWEYLLKLAPERHDISESIQRAKQFINQTESP